MPLATDNVTIPFDGKSEQLVAETNKVIAQLERVKAKVQTDGRILEQQARRDAEALKKSTMSITDFRSAYQIGLDVMRAGKMVWDETAGATFKYDEEIRRLAEITGTGAEESSRLLQVLDDFKISAGELNAVTRKMTQQGLSPTLETLARLSDEYNRLNPGQERAKFLMDNFGRSGFKFAEAMSKGGDELRKMGGEVEKSLIRTDEQIAKTRLAELAFDKWSDKIQAVKVDLGTGFIGAVDGSTWAIQKQAEEIYTTATGADYLRDQMFGLTEAQRAEWEEAKKAATEQYLLSQGIDLTAEAAQGLTMSLEELEESTRLHEAAVKELSKTNADFLSGVESISKRNADYEQSIKDIDAAFSEGKITIDERKQKLDELEKKHADATHSMMFDMLQLQLSEDGLSKSETNYLLQTAVNWGIASKESIDEMKKIQTEVDALTRKYKSVPSVVTTTFVSQYTSLKTTAPNYYQSEKRDSGGMGVPGRSYAIGTGAQPEVFTPSTPGNFTPAGDIIDYDRLGGVIARRMRRELENLANRLDW